MITVTLPTGKLLKEVGWNKPTVFSYHIAISEKAVASVVEQPWNNWAAYISAPTAQELMEALPMYLQVRKIKNGWLCTQWTYDTDLPEPKIHTKNESLCEALAALWLEINKKP